MIDQPTGIVLAATLVPAAVGHLLPPATEGRGSIEADQRRAALAFILAVGIGGALTVAARDSRPAVVSVAVVVGLLVVRELALRGADRAA